jgi:hypothetical protein
VRLFLIILTNFCHSLEALSIVFIIEVLIETFSVSLAVVFPSGGTLAVGQLLAGLWSGSPSAFLASRSFKGRLSNFRIWDSVRSSADIANFYKRVCSPEEPVSMYRYVGTP